MSLLRKRRGVSGIISGVFLVAVAVMIFNVLAWQFFQYDAYHRTVLERDQLAWERYNERLIVYLPEVGVSKLNFTVRNYGSVSAHIVDLFFIFNNGTHLYYRLDVWLGPGALKRIADVGPTLQLTDVYYFQIGTERGNTTGPIPTGSGGISNEPTPGQGQAMPFVFGFGYDDWQYLNSSSQWTAAWRLPKTGSIGEFRIILNNTYNAPVTIHLQTRLAYYPEDWASSSAVYSINTVKTGSLKIPAKSAKTIYFGPNPCQFNKARYYCFVEIFFYLDNPSQVYGTQVGVLTCYTV